MVDEGEEAEESERAEAGDDTGEEAAAGVGGGVGEGWQALGKASVRAEVDKGVVAADSASSGCGGDDVEVDVDVTAAFRDDSVFVFRRSRHVAHGERT